MGRSEAVKVPVEMLGFVPRNSDATLLIEKENVLHGVFKQHCMFGLRVFSDQFFLGGWLSEGVPYLSGVDLQLSCET